MPLNFDFQPALAGVDLFSAPFVKRVMLLVASVFLWCFCNGEVTWLLRLPSRLCTRRPPNCDMLRDFRELFDKDAFDMFSSSSAWRRSRSTIALICSPFRRFGCANRSNRVMEKARPSSPKLSFKNEWFKLKVVLRKIIKLVDTMIRKRNTLEQTVERCKNAFQA